jgi:hypothetical protein
VEYSCLVHDISRNGISFEFSTPVVTSDGSGKPAEFKGNFEFSFLYGNIFVTGTARYMNTRYLDTKVVHGCRLVKIHPYDFVQKLEINAACGNVRDAIVYYHAS